MNLKTFTATSCAALLISAAPALAVTIVFDSFDTDQSVSDVPSASKVNSSTVSSAAGDIFGGTRTMTVTNTSTDGNPQDATTLEAYNSHLSFSNNTGARGIGTLLYDGGGAGLGNLLFKTTNFFTFDVVSFDNDGIIDFTFHAVDGAGNTATYTESLVSGFSPTLSFAEILAADPGNAGFDFGDVYSIAFTVDTTNQQASLDGSIAGITLSAVPLPAAGFLLIGGLGGLAALRRRRKA